MQLNPLPTELVTAATDLLLGLLGVCCVCKLQLAKNYRSAIWTWVFSLLAAASFLGFIAHGFDLAEGTRDLVWMPLNLSLGLTLGLFVVGAVCDLAGVDAARSTMPSMIVLGLLFFGITVFIPGTFLTFIVYEAVAMLIALGIYTYLTVNKALAGAGWIAGGVLVTMVAAAIQATGKAGSAIFWHFDNNGVFHLIQMIAIVLLFTGVNQGLRSTGT